MFAFDYDFEEKLFKLRVVDAVVFFIFAHASEQNCQSVFVDDQGDYSASEGEEV